MDEQKNLCITVAELAEQLGVSKPIAYRVAHRADFPSVRLGRRLVIPRAALEQWLRDHAGQTI